MTSRWHASPDVRRLAAVMGLLRMAPAEDAVAVVRGFDEGTVAAVIEDVSVRLPQGVVDDALESGSSALTVALALRMRGAATGPATRSSDVIRRTLLRLADPRTDQVIIDGNGAADWEYDALVTRTLSPAGRPVVDPDVKRGLLLAARRRVGEENGPDEAMDRPFVEALLMSEDPELVLAALPLTAWSASDIGPEVCGVLCLDEHGMLGEARRRGHLAVLEQTVAWALLRSYDRVLRLADGHAEEAAVLGASLGLSRAYQERGGRLPLLSDDKAWGDGIRFVHPTVRWREVIVRARREEGRECPSLDEAAHREDWPPELRADFEDAYPRAALFAWRPDRGSLVRSRAVLAGLDLPPATRHETVRSQIVRGFEAESLDPLDVLRYGAPAAEVLAVAAPDGVGFAREQVSVFQRPPDAASRGRARLCALVRRLLATSLGSDRRCWEAIVAAVPTWGGSLIELIDAVVVDGGGVGDTFPGETPAEFPAPVPAPNAAYEAAATAVFLSLAPPEVTEHILSGQTDRARGPLVLAMLEQGPLTRPLVEYALGSDGSPAVLRALIQNPATPESVLCHLVRRDPPPAWILASVYFHKAASDGLRGEIVHRTRAVPGFHTRLVGRAASSRNASLVRPLLASREPLVLHRLLSEARAVVSEDERRRAYAVLAEIAGAEVVWALEQERVGSLRDMDASVRASMATGDVQPLLDAASRSGAAMTEAVVPDLAALLPPDFGDELSPAAGFWRLEDAIREHFDGRPDRWHALSRRLMAAADSPDSVVSTGSPKGRMEVVAAVLAVAAESTCAESTCAEPEFAEPDTAESRGPADLPIIEA